MNRRSLAIILVGAVVGTLLLAKLRRDEEWEHGGDGVLTAAELRITGSGGLRAAVAALGGPAAETPRVGTGTQAVVVRVQWSGPSKGGFYHLALLDTRVVPPLALLPVGGWNADGATESWTGSAFSVLPRHYAWLTGGPEPVRRVPVGWQESFGVIAAPASVDGSMTAVFVAADGGSPLVDARPLMGAWVYTDTTGTVRWAKPVPLGSL